MVVKRDGDDASLQEHFIRKEDAFNCYLLAREYPDEVDVQRLQECVLKCGDSADLFLFARDVKEADVERIQEALIKKEKLTALRLFKEQNIGTNTEKIDDMITLLEF